MNIISFIEIDVEVFTYEFKNIEFKWKYDQIYGKNIFFLIAGINNIYFLK